MKKIKSQKVIFKGIDGEGNEMFSWLGEENHYNENEAVILHKKYNKDGQVFEQGESTYEGDQLIKDVYNCTDEGTSTVSSFKYDEKGRDLETRIDYEGYSEIQKFTHQDGVTEIRFEDEEGEFEKSQKNWYDTSNRIIKVEIYGESGNLEEKEERTYTEDGNDLTHKTVEGESENWTLQTYEYDVSGNQIGCTYVNNYGVKEVVFTKKYDDKNRVLSVVQSGQQEVEFDYEGDDYMSQTIYNLAQGRQLAAHTKFYKESGHPVKTISTHNIRSYIVDSMAAMGSGVASYEYHFENEYYD